MLFTVNIEDDLFRKLEEAVTREKIKARANPAKAEPPMRQLTQKEFAVAYQAFQKGGQPALDAKKRELLGLPPLEPKKGGRPSGQPSKKSLIEAALRMYLPTLELGN
jgi:hypothetical protein